MKALKIIGIIILVLIALFLLVALALPSEYRVERSIVVERQPEFVFNQIGNFNNFEKWNPWMEREPDAKSIVTGTPMTPGHKWEWEGEKTGKGFLEIEEIDPGRMVDSKLVFQEPNTMEADNIMTLRKTGAGTKVTWKMTGELGYPGGRYIGLFLDGMLGPDFEKGLKNLKEHTETSPDQKMPKDAAGNDDKPREKMK